MVSIVDGIKIIKTYSNFNKGLFLILVLLGTMFLVLSGICFYLAISLDTLIGLISLLFCVIGFGCFSEAYTVKNNTWLEYEIEISGNTKIDAIQDKYCIIRGEKGSYIIKEKEGA